MLGESHKKYRYIPRTTGLMANERTRCCMWGRCGGGAKLQQILRAQFNQQESIVGMAYGLAVVQQQPVPEIACCSYIVHFAHRFLKVVQALRGNFSTQRVLKGYIGGVHSPADFCSCTSCMLFRDRGPHSLLLLFGLQLAWLPPLRGSATIVVGSNLQPTPKVLLSDLQLKNECA